MAASDSAGPDYRLDPPCSASSPPLRRFRVRVGVAECMVLCRDEREAVQLARVKIGRENPQVSAVIFNILDKEFRVDPAS